jgi:hypothetical protein
MRRNHKLLGLAAALMVAAAAVVWWQGAPAGDVLRGYAVGLPFYLAPTLAIIWIWAAVRRRRRRKAIESGRCPSCGYDLAGNVSGVCPECGVPVERVG